MVGIALFDNSDGESSIKIISMLLQTANKSVGFPSVSFRRPYPTYVVVSNLE